MEQNHTNTQKMIRKVHTQENETLSWKDAAPNGPGAEAASLQWTRFDEACNAPADGAADDAGWGSGGLWGDAGRGPR